METENNYNDYNKTHIQFQEVRDFGALMGAAFTFYKQEFKLLTKALLFFAAPFVVIGTVLLGIMGNLLMDFRGPEESMVIQIFSFIGGFILLLLIGYSMVNAVIHNYTNIYVEKGKGNFDLDDIWQGVKSNFFKLFFDQFAIGIAVFIGLIFFYVPGIYLQTALSFVYIISVREKLPFTKAISRSFEVIKDNWWITFLVVMVVGMILGFISYIFIIPAYVIMIIGTTMNEFNAAMLYGGLASLLLLFLFQIFAYSIQQLTINFQYFSLVEEKESPELLRRVNAMRNTVDTEPESKFSFATEKENQPKEVNPFADSAKEDNKYDDFERFKPK